MDELKKMQERKRELLDQIAQIKDMRRGSVTEQYYEVDNKQGETVRQGPYLLYSYKSEGKTISRRLSGDKEAARYREEIEEFRRFEQISAQLVEASHEICDLKAQMDRCSIKGEPEKKLRKRSSRRSS
jgi:hypothetical protein